ELAIVDCSRRNCLGGCLPLADRRQRVQRIAARANIPTRACRSVVAVVLEQRAPFALSRRLRFGRASQIHHLYPRTAQISSANRRLGIVSPPPLLLNGRRNPFRVQLLDNRSSVDLGSAVARSFTGHLPVPFFFPQFAPPPSFPSHNRRPFARGVPTHA